MVKIGELSPSTYDYKSFDMVNRVEKGASKPSEYPDEEPVEESSKSAAVADPRQETTVSNGEESASPSQPATEQPAEEDEPERREGVWAAPGVAHVAKEIGATNASLDEKRQAGLEKAERRAAIVEENNLERRRKVVEAANQARERSAASRRRVLENQILSVEQRYNGEVDELDSSIFKLLNMQAEIDAKTAEQQEIEAQIAELQAKVDDLEARRSEYQEKLPEGYTKLDSEALYDKFKKFNNFIKQLRSEGKTDKTAEDIYNAIGNLLPIEQELDQIFQEQDNLEDQKNLVKEEINNLDYRLGSQNLELSDLELAREQLLNNRDREIEELEQSFEENSEAFEAHIEEYLTTGSDESYKFLADSLGQAARKRVERLLNGGRFVDTIRVNSARKEIAKALTEISRDLEEAERFERQLAGSQKILARRESDKARLQLELENRNRRRVVETGGAVKAESDLKTAEIEAQKLQLDKLKEDLELLEDMGKSEEEVAKKRDEITASEEAMARSQTELQKLRDQLENRNNRIKEIDEDEREGLANIENYRHQNSQSSAENTVVSGVIAEQKKNLKQAAENVGLIADSNGQYRRKRGVFSMIWTPETSRALVFDSWERKLARQGIGRNTAERTTMLISSRSVLREENLSPYLNEPSDENITIFQRVLGRLRRLRPSENNERRAES